MVPCTIIQNSKTNIQRYRYTSLRAIGGTALAEVRIDQLGIKAHNSFGYTVHLHWALL
jgi:hypothetical protein